MKVSNYGKFLYAITVSLMTVSFVAAEDWPQFHGPRRDNHSRETRLLTQWPEGGPMLIWKIQEIGNGYSSVAIAGKLIYITGEINKENVITALDPSGQKIWRQKNGPAYTRSHPGTRSTPTIMQGKLYNLSGTGNLICLDALMGRPIWTLNILDKFNGRNTRWGMSESPLLDGDKVICCPGGEKVGMVALHKDTGKIIWTTPMAGNLPGYGSAILVDYKGLRQIVTMTSHSALGVAADSGKLLWRYPHTVRFEANCDTPLYHDGHLYLFGTWGRGATKLKLIVEGNDCSVKEIWRTAELDNEHGGVILENGYLYGQADGDHKNRHWACLDSKTGNTMWAGPEFAGQRSASLTFADGMLYIVSDRGQVGLLRPDPKQMDIISRFELPMEGHGPVYAHPVVCGGQLYLRHGDFLYAYDIRSKTESINNTMLETTSVNRRTTP